MKELYHVSITEITVEPEIPEGYEIIEPERKRHFKCYYCQAEFRANHKHYYKTQTGWGCKCPICEHACYTKY